MAFLDFIKNRQSQQQPAEQSLQSKPETAREMYSRQAVEEKTSARAMDQMPPAQQAKVAEISAQLQKATQHIRQDAPSFSPAPADSTASPQPMAQKMVGQESTAPALSPTSAQAGVRSTEREAPAKSQEHTAKSKTMARTQPSWER